MKSRSIKYFVLLGSIVFIIIGVYRREVETALQKAINICLECIGIE